MNPKAPTNRITTEEARQGKLPEWTCRSCRKSVHPSQLQGLRTGQLGICPSCIEESAGEVTDEQIEAHTTSHDEAQEARTDVCTDCGRPIDSATFTVATRRGYESQVRKFDGDARGLGRYTLVWNDEGLPYARRVSFEGTHNLHICEALRDQELIRPTEPWVELSEDAMVDEIRERMHWSNTPDPSDMGGYR